VSDNDLKQEPNDNVNDLVRNYQAVLEYLLYQHKELSDQGNILNSDLSIMNNRREENDNALLHNKEVIEKLRTVRDRKKEDVRAVKSCINNAKKAALVKNTGVKFLYCNICQNKRFTSLDELHEHNEQKHTRKKKDKESGYKYNMDLAQTMYIQQASMGKFYESPKTSTAYDQSEVKKLQSECAGLMEEMKKQHSSQFNDYTKQLIEKQAKDTHELLKDLSLTHDAKVNNLINELDRFKKTVACNLQEIADMNKENTPILNLLHKKRTDALHNKARTSISDVPDFNLISERCREASNETKKPETKKSAIKLKLKEEPEPQAKKSIVRKPNNKESAKQVSENNSFTVVPIKVEQPIKIEVVAVKAEETKTESTNGVILESIKPIPLIDEEETTKPRSEGKLMTFKAFHEQEEPKIEKVNKMESKNSIVVVDPFKTPKDLKQKDPIKEVNEVFTVRNKDEIPDYSFCQEKRGPFNSEEDEIFKKIPIKIDDSTEKRRNTVISQAVDYTPLLDIFNRFLSRDNNFIEFGNLNKYKTILEQPPVLNRAKVEENLNQLSKKIFERPYQNICQLETADLKKKLLEKYEGLLNRQTYFQIYDSNIFNLLNFNQQIYFTTNSQVRDMKKVGTL
jgi:hypothetical protein